MEGAINEGYHKTPNWPLVLNLRMDPFERSPDSALYIRWFADQMWMFVPAQQIVGAFLKSFVEYPPSQALSSLSVEKVMQTMQEAASRQ